MKTRYIITFPTNQGNLVSVTGYASVSMNFRME